MRPWSIHGAAANLAWLLLFLAFLSGEARADAFDRHYNQAMAHAQGGRYAESLAEMEAAYALRHFPRLLFNLGQLHRQVGHRDEAVRCFERFLAEEPGLSPERRTEVVGYLAELRPVPAPEDPAPAPAASRPVPVPSDAAPPPSEAAQPAPQRPAPPPPAGRPAAPRIALPAPVQGHWAPRRDPIYRRWWFWTAIGGVAAAGIVAGVLLGTRLRGPADPPPQVPIYNVPF